MSSVKSKVTHSRATSAKKKGKGTPQLQSLHPNVTSGDTEGKKGSRLFVKGYDENGKMVFERVWSKEFEEMSISLPKMKPPTPLKQATIEAFFTARVGERGEGLEDKPETQDTLDDVVDIDD